MRFLGKVMCFIDWHKFDPMYVNSYINPLPVEVCSRCGIGQQWNIAGFCIRYSKQQIDDAAEALRQRQREGA